MSTALHPIEVKILSALLGRSPSEFNDLVKDAGVTEDQARRAVQWLSSKKLVSIHESSSATFEVARTPPELLLMEKISSKGADATLDGVRSQFASPEEFSAALGRARAAGWVTVSSGPPPTIVVKDARGPGALASLVADLSRGRAPSESDPLLKDLLRRGVVVRKEVKQTSVEITPAGRTAASAPAGAREGAETIERLTPEVLASKAWKGKALRPIDVEAKAPVFYPGRRHPVRDFIREVREVYVSMGFTEVEGNSVHPAFWNFDALFVPQDHPGREMQDTFYLEGLSDPTLSRKGVVANVASTHENGWRTGSRGWGYVWRIEEARRLLLRTHNTVLTVKALSESKEKETRVFAVSKVYRNENLDYKHLAEFYQMDGIIVGEGLNVRHLMGFLKEFYKKLGMKEVRLWPTYFPYTEPSLEVVGYSEVSKSWIELSGSGVFRPEVTVPLGVKVPVLAWGPGIERLMLMRYGLDDVRALYEADVNWLRRRVEYASR